jgi:IS5 family transposase
MYRYTEQQMIMPHEFFLPFGGKLNPKNHWCQMAMLIPWAEVERKYAVNFENLRTGQVACSVRIALGSLIIQNQKGLSDRHTVEEITENPYLQYFIGLPRFAEEPPFDPSLMVHFRKRLGKDIINEINEIIAKPDVNRPKGPDDQPPAGGGGSGEEDSNAKEESKPEPGNSGKLILDATCTPADIHFPTDIWLLNNVREALEEIIDILHKPLIGISKKPRTYRDCARRDYLNIDKKKRASAREIRKAIGQQLRYVKRDLAAVEVLAEKSPLTLLSRRQYHNLLVSHEIYRQQLAMYQKKLHKAEDRIVSLHMPFVRPIVRGKAKAEVEFGAKLAISVVDGYSYMEHLSFDAFNEGTTLITSAENYRQRFGFYPEAIIVDKIYRNRDNLQFCKKNHIRLNGPPLGRPTKDTELLKEQKRQERKDTGIRNEVEGKFGEGKRAYSMNRIMARLRETSETVIAMQLLVMNLEHRLRILFFQIFKVQFWATEWAV